MHEEEEDEGGKGGERHDDEEGQPHGVVAQAWETGRRGMRRNEKTRLDEMRHRERGARHSELLPESDVVPGYHLVTASMPQSREVHSGEVETASQPQHPLFTGWIRRRHITDRSMP